MTAGFPRRPPAWRRYLRFWRRDIDADTDDEIRLHVERRTEDLVIQGLARDAAWARATEEFGDLEVIRGELREIDRMIERRHVRGEWLGSLRDDVRYTARSLRRSRGFVAMVMVTLALGLGLNAAMFTFIDDVFFKPPAGVPAPARIHRVWTTYYNTSDRTPFAVSHASYPQYLAMVGVLGRDGEMALYEIDTHARVGRGAAAPTVVAAKTTTNYRDVLGVRVTRGRWFTADENRLGAAAPVSLVSDRYARAHGGSDLVGQPLLVENHLTTIIGIMPPRFTGPDLDAVDVWLPIGVDAAGRGPKPWWEDDRANNMSLVARLRPHVDLRGLEARFTAATQRSGGSVATAALAAGVKRPTISLGPINEARGPGQKLPAVTLATRLAVVALLVLVIACANIINLLSARAVLRRRELALRAALGAGRARLMRLLTVEGVLLALGAGAAALAAAWWGGTLLRVLLMPATRWSARPVSLRAVAFTGIVSIAAGVVIGLAPAVRASTPNLIASLREGGEAGATRRSPMRATLVGVQAALALVLLAASLLAVASLRNVEGIDLGFDAQRLLFVNVGFETRPANAFTVVNTGYRALFAELAHAPHVEAAALATMEPMTGFSWADSVFLGRTPILDVVKDWRNVPTYTAVSGPYFETVGLRMVRGEPFDAHETRNVAIVNQRMAELAWPGRSPLGQCLRIDASTGPCYAIIGVTENSNRDNVIESSETPQYYLPLDHMPPGETPSMLSVLVRAEPGAMPAVVADVRDRLRRIFPTGEPQLERMSDYLDRDYRPFRLGAMLFTTFGVLALIVVLVGIYSAVAYSVRQRVRELSIRVALGAGVGDVIRLVLGEELRAVFVGCALGVVLVLAGGRVIRSLLYGIGSSDARVLAGVSVLMLVAAGVAALVPARRAGRVDPAGALKAD